MIQNGNMEICVDKRWISLQNDTNFTVGHKDCLVSMAIRLWSDRHLFVKKKLSKNFR